MSINDHFDGLVEPSLPVLYCPPNAPDDVVPAIVADSAHGGIVNINIFPTASRRESRLRTGVPHISDPRLFDHENKPTELAKSMGYWMFPKWYEDLMNLKVVESPRAEAPEVEQQKVEPDNKVNRKAKG